MKTVQSYGVACVRKRKEYEILMIKRRCTYAFSLFVVGGYNSLFEAQNLANQMTMAEKNIILHGDFGIAYFHAFGCRRDALKDKRHYDRLEKIFYSHNTDRLNGILKNSSYGNLNWEFPKGRKEASENDIVAAMREFEEETGITKYNILWNAKPYFVSFTDGGIKYKYSIYTAISSDEPLFDPAVKNCEISEISWVPASSATHLLRGDFFGVFKAVVKNIKKQKHLLPPSSLI
jgi:8-oxo-dGTP pyrophosphatase MutT (NUDIX family)